MNGWGMGTLTYSDLTNSTVTSMPTWKTISIPKPVMSETPPHAESSAASMIATEIIHVGVGLGNVRLHVRRSGSGPSGPVGAVGPVGYPDSTAGVESKDGGTATGDAAAGSAGDATSQASSQPHLAMVTFQVHQDLLVQDSVYFRTLFETDASVTSIDLTDIGCACDDVSMNQYLQTVYNPMISCFLLPKKQLPVGVHFDSLCKTVELASYLHSKTLLLFEQQLMMIVNREPSTDTVMTTLELAHRFNLPTVKPWIEKFTALNLMEGVLQCPREKWLSLSPSITYVLMQAMSAQSTIAVGTHVLVQVSKDVWRKAEILHMHGTGSCNIRILGTGSGMVEYQQEFVPLSQIGPRVSRQSTRALHP